jgi:ABC-type multidrug transport system fused ATPase/permease subunit
VFVVLDTPIEVEDVPGAESLERAVGRVEFHDVRFAYKTGPDILHGLDIVIEAGRTLAIVGPTGAGKTTLINLVPRFYDPTGGRVLVDGTDVRELTLSSLRTNFGIVLQEPFLFSGTIADNIRYGRLRASDEDLRRAADLAGASEFIAALPKGLDTEVGERGATLSTGQRQLIAFARAIVGDPAILILDEATSSVDTRTEMLIQAGLRNILKDRTSIIIAHRLSTVRDADTIVVLDAGRVVETGSYTDLMSYDGAFFRLHSAQFSAE